MKAFLELELRGDNTRQFAKMYEYIGNDVSPGLGTSIFHIPATSWVAEITGTDQKYKYARRFLGYKKDYSRSNSKGSRGLYAEYILESDRIYDVKDFKNRYFCTVNEEGDIKRLTETEVQEWVKNHSG